MIRFFAVFRLALVAFRLPADVVDRDVGIVLLISAEFVNLRFSSNVVGIPITALLISTMGRSCILFRTNW